MAENTGKFVQFLFGRKIAKEEKKCSFLIPVPVTALAVYQIANFNAAIVQLAGDIDFFSILNFISDNIRDSGQTYSDAGAIFISQSLFTLYSLKS